MIHSFSPIRYFFYSILPYLVNYNTEKDRDKEVGNILAYYA
jgi:hypothetical protein